MADTMLQSDDMRNWVSLGFIALFRGLNDHAAAIFDGVQAARPAQEAGVIGRALVDLARGELEAAIAALRALPPSDGARTFLAVALARRGDRTEARALLSELNGRASDAAYATLAREILDELDARRDPLFK